VQEAHGDAGVGLCALLVLVVPAVREREDGAVGAAVREQLHDPVRAKRGEA